MSSSSESEDENLKQFAAAVDTSLFNNEFYKPIEEKKVKEEKNELKSQRYLDNTENIFQSELNISEPMKDFIGKKMSKLINDSIEFVDFKKRKIDDEHIDCIKLLKGSKRHVRLDKSDQYRYPQIKVPIKRRIVEDDKLSESFKAKLAATDISKIDQEVSMWKKKYRREALRYKKSSDGKICHMMDEPNEYSKIRAKNVWNESKIKSAKYFNKGLGSLSHKNE